MTASYSPSARPDAPPSRRVGTSGLAVSVVGLGCNNLGRTGTDSVTPEGAHAVVHAALDAGITFFDTADNYGAEGGLSERLLGAALGSERDNVVIGTKFGMANGRLYGPDHAARGSRRYIRRAVEGSLTRLGTDRLDLLQFHTPDPLTPIDETLAALDDLVREGKVLYVGHSNRAGWQIADAEHVARATGSTRFISSQSHYNLLDRRAELEVVPAAQAYGLGIFPYFPLANGLLSGKYSRNTVPTEGRLSHTRQHMLDEAPWDAIEQLTELGRERGLGLLELAFSWLAAQPQVASVIAGATRPEQVRQNAAAVHELTADELAQMDALFPPPAKVALF
ncbi:aldo/keto reductase [Sanguibacter sp. A247]|uniref:aldo/keto reductase n=1 Tax=unclassified Sanguibacter TaxID=2645534 RepID=UPI003FD8892C